MGRVRLPRPHRVHADFSRHLPLSAASCLPPYLPTGASAPLLASLLLSDLPPSSRYIRTSSAKPHTTPTILVGFSPPLPRGRCRFSPGPNRAELSCRVMNILNKPINPRGGHPVFPAAKESGQPMPASVRFDGLSTQPSTAAMGRSHAHSPRWQAQTLRRASSYVGVEHEESSAMKSAGQAPGEQSALATAAALEPFQPLTLNVLRSLLDRDSMSSIADGVAGEDSAAPPLHALRVVVSSAVELDAHQTELIARKMRRITGFVNLTIENVVDLSLIAGFVVCYGPGDSHVIDLSVKGQLAALKNRVDSSDHDDRLHPRTPTPLN